MSRPQLFMTLTRTEQRQRFYDITSLCEDHTEQALTQKSHPWTFQAGIERKNGPRNRYSNVFPWDYTRVHLPKSISGTDYINASWIKLERNQYIAAQGPLDNTIHHFWAMCFDQAQHQKSDVIFVAMVTPLVEQNREKCAKYWPSKKEGRWDLSKAMREEFVELTDFTLAWVSETVHEDLVMTKLKVECKGVVKTVVHCHYAAWKDTLAPESPRALISLSKEWRRYQKIYPELVPVVHCSAGVGRTGTFIAIDHFLNSSILRTHSDPVFDTVRALRDQRMMMVQTLSQYCFLYDTARTIRGDQSGSSSA